MDARRLRRAFVHFEGDLVFNSSTLWIADALLNWVTGTLDLSVA